MLTFAGNTPRNSATAASAPNRRVPRASSSAADAHLGDSRSVRVEPRASGQLGGDDRVERFGRQEVEGAHADQQRRDSVCECLVGVPGNCWGGGHRFIVPLAQGGAARRSAGHHGAKL